MEKTQLQTELENALSNMNFVDLDKLARQAIEQHPEEAFPYYCLGEVLLAQEKPGQAEVLFSRAIDLQDNNLNFWFKYAVAQEAQLNFDEAANTYRLILEKDPNNKLAIHSLGLYSMRHAGKYSDALYYFNLLLETDPSDTSLYINRGEALIGAERFEEALESLGFALAQSFDPVGTALKIEALKGLSRTAEIYPLYEELIEHAPNEFGYAYDYAVELAKDNQFDKAAIFFEKALSLLPAEAPFDPVVQRPAAEVYVHVGKYAEAIAILDQCVATDPETPKETYLARAEARSHMGNFDGALEDISQASKMADYNEFVKAVVEATKAEILIRMNKMEEAEAIGKKLAQDPMLAEAGFYIEAVIANKKGNSKAAYQAALKALPQPKAKTFIQKDLADYLARMKNNVLTKLAPEFAKNAQSPVINRLVGKLWRFDQLRTPNLPDMSALPAEEQASIREFLQPFFIFFSEKEVFFHLPVLAGDDKAAQRNTVYAYRVSGEKGNLIQIQLFSLDAESVLNFKMRLEADGSVWLDKGNEKMLRMVVQNPLTVSPKMQAAFKHFFTKAEIAGASASAKPAIDMLLDA